MAIKAPNFRSAIMGYHKADVTEFLTRTESEMEVYESRQAAAEKTIASMKNEIETLTGRLQILTEENFQLETANTQLRQTSYDDKQISADEHEKVLTENHSLLEENKALKEKLAELERKAAADTDTEAEQMQQLLRENAELKETSSWLNGELQSCRDSYQALRKECDELRANVDALEQDRKSIQDALVSAHRMGEIVLDEARSEAGRLTAEAQQQAQNVTLEAQQFADQTLAEAQQRNFALQQSYDKMLMDTSELKLELIDLYRRHLALLSEIPGKGEVPVLEENVRETVIEE